MEDKMMTHARFSNDQLPSSTDLGQRLSHQIIDRYGIDPRLASEMAWDLLELLDAVDADREVLGRVYLR